MQIIEQTPTKLKLKANYRARIIAQIIIGSPFFLGGLAIIAIFGQLASLECHRFSFSQTSCQLISSGVLGRTVTRLTALQKAEVSLKRVKNSKNYKVILITQQGKVPLTVYDSSNEQEIDRIANKINTFIKQQQQSLLVEQIDRWFPSYVFGLIFILVGAIVIGPALLYPLEISYTFNKEIGLLQLQTQNLFGTKSVEKMLDEVEQIKIVGILIKHSKTYHLSLILRSQQQISLLVYENFSQQQAEEIANQIRQLLNLPQ
ncbi:MAG: hypothetical protein RMY34_05110 [Aulosira sp. DedQUE10]|nr:hypothetical protein [Aulosira sp. DedQUE10]